MSAVDHSSLGPRGFEHRLHRVKCFFVNQRADQCRRVERIADGKLTVRGKALEGGTEGDVISVLNEQSKRTVQGVIVGPGRVVISTGSPRLAANLTPSSGKSR